MRRIALLSVALLALGSASCAKPPGGGGTGSIPTPPPAATFDVTPYIEEVRNGIFNFCGYQVQGRIAAGLLSAIGVPYVGMVSSVIEQGCAALGRAGARRGGMARGIAIVGGKRVVVEGVKVK